MKPKTYSERVLPGASFFFAITPLPLAVWLVFLPMNAVLGALSGLLAYLAVLVSTYLLAPRIEVSGGYLRVGRAKIEIQHIGGVQILAPEESFRAKTLELDARAFTQFQIGVKGLVRVEVKDRTDPTPYWLFNVRGTQALVSALDANRT